MDGELTLMELLYSIQATGGMEGLGNNRYLLYHTIVHLWVLI